MKVLSFDPGKTTGIAYQDENATFAMTDTQDIYTWLEKVDLAKTPVDQVVIEDYVIKPHQATMNVGVKQDALETIGAIKFWAARNKIPVQMYDPKLKPTQCKLTGTFPKKMRKDIEHKFDAWNHGRFFLIQKKLAKTKLEMDMEKEGKL